ncbi:MAG: selenocysteine-specific translation elongation factor, partial [Acidobacteria bacterium]|nr:selenocysteine-specific translation elongation factor [Acidobacteriota bacterium]
METEQPEQSDPNEKNNCWHGQTHRSREDLVDQGTDGSGCERGITIDLGFADLTIDDVHFGFVDVPGHERFVRNMLAGAHGIDLVMLVVAADESLMPQTREHFEICRLLEVRSGLVVINKADLVEEDFLELVETEVAEYVAGSFLEGAPVLRVSARTGQGIDQLKQTLARLAKGVTPRDESAVARLPVDRVFTIRGFGSVVTGTLIAGSLRIGDELELLPSDNLTARVRNLQVHGQSTAQALAGERTAVNLQGIDLARIRRGQILAPAGRLRALSLLDVRLRLLAGAGRPLRTRSRVHLHLGTAEVLARVVLLGQPELMPGRECFAQLRLESPLCALPVAGPSPCSGSLDRHHRSRRDVPYLAERSDVPPRGLPDRRA